MKKVELESMKDLAYLASSSPIGATIQHFKDKDGNNIYFMFGGTIREAIIFYVKDQ